MHEFFSNKNMVIFLFKIEIHYPSYNDSYYSKIIEILF